MSDFADLLDQEVPGSFADPVSSVCVRAVDRARERLKVLDERIAAASELRERLAARLGVDPL